MAILDVQHMEKHFGATRVLEDISLGPATPSSPAGAGRP